MVQKSRTSTGDCWISSINRAWSPWGFPFPLSFRPELNWALGFFGAYPSLGRDATLVLAAECTGGNWSEPVESGEKSGWSNLTNIFQMGVDNHQLDSNIPLSEYPGPWKPHVYEGNPESFHIWVLGYLGYVPRVCWNFLRWLATSKSWLKIRGHDKPRLMAVAIAIDFFAGGIFLVVLPRPVNGGTSEWGTSMALTNDWSVVCCFFLELGFLPGQDDWDGLGGMGSPCLGFTNWWGRQQKSKSAGPFLPSHIYVISPFTKITSWSYFEAIFVADVCVCFIVWFWNPRFVGFWKQRKVHGMPSEFSLEFGSAMLMVRPKKWCRGTHMPLKKGKFGKSSTQKCLLKLVGDMWLPSLLVVFSNPQSPLLAGRVTIFASIEICYVMFYKRKLIVLFYHSSTNLWLFGFPVWATDIRKADAAS